MKKAYKALSVFIIVAMIVLAFSNVFAAVSLDNIKANEATEADDNIESIGSKILSIITGVGIVLSVVVIAVLGIKYMMGSTEEKAEYKKTMIPYVVGAVLVFGASTIATIVVDMGETLLND